MLSSNEYARQWMKEKYAKDPEFRERAKARMRQWRKDHPILNRKRNRERKARSTRFIYEYLKTHPCVDCGESDPVVLEFDHRSLKGKRYPIGSGRGSGILPKSLLKEIAKCDVRCCNCHRKRHRKDWWKLKYGR